MGSSASAPSSCSPTSPTCWRGCDGTACCRRSYAGFGWSSCRWSTPAAWPWARAPIRAAWTSCATRRCKPRQQCRCCWADTASGLHCPGFAGSQVRPCRPRAPHCAKWSGASCSGGLCASPSIATPASACATACGSPTRTRAARSTTWPRCMPSRPCSTSPAPTTATWSNRRATNTAPTAICGTTSTSARCNGR